MALMKGASVACKHQSTSIREVLRQGMSGNCSRHSAVQVAVGHLRVIIFCQLYRCNSVMLCVRTGSWMLTSMPEYLLTLSLHCKGVDMLLLGGRKLPASVQQVLA